MSWFRGAGAKASISPAGKGLVVYGPNGAGKSSFVDAIEYALTQRVQHLAHEYSGRNQEKGLLNTHIPDDTAATIEIVFEDKTSAMVSIDAAGRSAIEGDGRKSLANWECGRTVLRQDEVSQFVHASKGDKYSTLLPLLGLAHLETTAANLHKLQAAITRESGVKEAEGALRAADRQMREVWTESTDASTALRTLCEQYVDSHDHKAGACSGSIQAILDERIADASQLQRMHDTVGALAGVNVVKGARAVRKARDEVAKTADQSLQRQIEVMRSAEKFLQEISESEDQFECPACGQTVKRQTMLSHLTEELSRLQELVSQTDALRSKESALLRSVRKVVELCSTDEVVHWAQEADPRVQRCISEAAAFQIPELASELDTDEVERVIGDAVIAGGSAAFSPAPVTELVTAQRKLTAAQAMLAAEEGMRAASDDVKLAEIVGEVEKETRREIAQQTQKIIANVSSHVQRMWSWLHPADPIENIRLHVPNTNDKAIDIALKFHGKELESPRLTLSEGYRNSLGLCVFLAMALTDPAGPRPIVLDDVIVSLDRDHRGMVATLVTAEFPERQVLLFTHDRDWFAELRQQLDPFQWRFVRLQTYGNPAVGIREVDMKGALAEARLLIPTKPDTAANLARKAMDMELAVFAERLGLRGLAFQRGEKNDRRTAHEFLQHLITAGEKAFKVRKEKDYVANIEAVKTWKAADTLLLTWGNKGSHSDDVVTAEADQLIAACERALAAFECNNCSKRVTHLVSQANDLRQCECGALRWKQ